jgi:hypothetical protein
LLISMPVIDGLPNLIAVRTSRPPPTPITPALPCRRWYGSAVTSYSTHSSDAGLPSHCVIAVPACPSMFACAIITGGCGASIPAPQYCGVFAIGFQTDTNECAFHFE